MKIERLISIIMVLLERKKISAKKLAEMFEVTPRTIYRDIDAINLAGIPIIAYPGANGGIGIMDEYKVDKKLFTTSDITTLLIGLGGIASTLSGKDVVNTLAKVKSLISAEQYKDIELKANQISIDLTSWAGNRSFHINLEKIKKALNENKYVSFHYFNGHSEKSIRKVEPYQLVLKENNWYLQGYCTLREEFRIFKLTRISALEILDEQFTLREFHAKALDGSEWIEKKMIMVKLLADESLRERLVERCGEENIEAYGENQLLVNLPFVEDELGYSLLLSFGDKCECIEPQNVRLEVIRRAKKVLDVYNS